MDAISATLRGDDDGSFAGAVGAADLDTVNPLYFTQLAMTNPGISSSQFRVYPT